MRGVVNAHFEPIVPLRVRGPSLSEIWVDAVVDSGSTASLTLPQAVIESLGLEFKSVVSARLADGAVSNFSVYLAEVEWCDAWRSVLVSAVGEEVLLGMRLLAGNRLRMDIVPGGIVEISPL